MIEADPVPEPYMRPPKVRHSTVLSVHRDTFDELMGAARERGVTVSDIVSEIVERDWGGWTPASQRQT